ncbi:MAG: SGNH/GDSL hydrolase family protein [Candidatus Nanopelagicales bacterium]
MAGIPARKVASAAAIGAGGLIAAGLTVAGAAFGQGLYAKRTIGVRNQSAPYADGLYGPKKRGTSIRFVMLGDSSAAGLGADSALDTVGARLAQGLVDAADTPVRYINMATVGAKSVDLDEQVTRALLVKPQIVTIMIGANDVTHLTPHKRACDALGEAVERLVVAGSEVVVGTCPDLGTIQPFLEPLRSVAKVSSGQLSKQQAVAVVEAGGRSVSLGSLLGPLFGSEPQEMFAADRFHPSSAGYAKAAEVLLPSMLDSLGLDPIDTDLNNEPIDEGVSSMTVAAELANVDAGTELVALDEAEQPDGDAKYWVRALRRVLRPVRRAEKPEPLSTDDYSEVAAM